MQAEPHPGEEISDRLARADVSPSSLAAASGVSVETIKAIIACQAPLDVDTALRLAPALGTTASDLLATQAFHDMAALCDSPDYDLSEVHCLDPAGPYSSIAAHPRRRGVI